MSSEDNNAGIEVGSIVRVHAYVEDSPEGHVLAVAYSAAHLPGAIKRSWPLYTGGLTPSQMEDLTTWLSLSVTRAVSTTRLLNVGPAGPRRS